MAPLLLCGFGTVFVLLRITSSDVDLVPDSVGLMLYAYGLWRVASNRAGLLAASTLAGVAAVLALSFFAPDWLHGSAEDTRDVCYGVTVAGCLGLGAWGLRARARAAEDDGVGRQLFVIALAQGIVAAVLVIGFAINGSDHERALAIIGSASVLGLLATIWYAVLLIACAGRTWAQPIVIPPGKQADNAPEMRETPGPPS
jgi:hypothetical protein